LDHYLSQRILSSQKAALPDLTNQYQPNVYTLSGCQGAASAVASTRRGTIFARLHFHPEFDLNLSAIPRCAIPLLTSGQSISFLELLLLENFLLKRFSLTDSLQAPIRSAATIS